MSTTTQILNPSALASNFVKRLPGFPAPTEEPTMIYNYNKLMVILQNRELAAVEPNAVLVSDAHSLATQFGGLTRAIVKKQLTDEEFNLKYDGLQRDIEDALTGTMYLYARQWGLSVKALYYYKKNRFEKAIDLSLECIVLNEHLIKTGIDTLLFRAAEQNKNIVRVFFKQNKIEEACSLTQAMFSYLFNGATESMYGSIFSEEKYRNRVPYVREGYAYEFFRAIVSLVMNLDRVQELGERAFRNIFSTLEIDVDTPDRQIITDWIAIKSKFYDRDYEAFFELLNTFFEEPICKIYDVIKISLLLDVSSIDKASTSRAILDYINQHLNGEFYLNTDLSSKNLVSLTA